ncbi:MAG: hypothetical protein GX304_01685 [Clostridiales bacterium]|jgi:hypothetical protein|nr:hypothetical protein [Clostridiales bacterium]
MSNEVSGKNFGDYLAIFVKQKSNTYQKSGKDPSLFKGKVAGFSNVLP